tara:strand:+ start:130 stop:510 length:381 start_codon:yes stop_codon:yes gene_type:complete
MKKFLFVIFLNLIFNVNANAFFDPVYRCNIDGVYRTFDMGEIKEVSGKVTSSGIFLTTKTKSKYELMEMVYTSKHELYYMWWTINRKSLVVEVRISIKTNDQYSVGRTLKDATTYTNYGTGLCKKV